MNAADEPMAAPEGKVQVTLQLHPGMPLRAGMHVLGTVTCEGLDAPGAFLLLDPKSFNLVLVAPCGCHAQLNLPEAISGLRQAVAEAHPAGGAKPACLH